MSIEEGLYLSQTSRCHRGLNDADGRHRVGQSHHLSHRVRLLYKAFDKMCHARHEGRIEPWWDSAHRSRGAGALTTKTVAITNLSGEFYTLFQPALAGLKERLAQRQEPFDNHQDRLLQARWRHLIAVLTLLNEQTNRN